MNLTQGMYESAARAVLKGSAWPDVHKAGAVMWAAMGRDGLSPPRAEKALREALGDVDFDWPWLDCCLAAGADGTWLAAEFPDVEGLSPDRAGKALRKARRIFLLGAVLHHACAAYRIAQLRDARRKFWIYRADDCPVPSHAALGGLALETAHGFWREYSPPSFIGCCCRLVGADGPATIAQMGGDARKPPPRQ